MYRAICSSYSSEAITRQNVPGSSANTSLITKTLTAGTYIVNVVVTYEQSVSAGFKIGYYRGSNYYVRAELSKPATGYTTLSFTEIFNFGSSATIGIFGAHTHTSAISTSGFLNILKIK